MRLAVVAASLLLFATVSAQAPKPLPDQASFLREVRARLEPDQERQRDYVYMETRREIRVDGAGTPIGQTVKVFESYPGLPGESRWLRLVSRDGTPVPQEELARADRKRQEKAEAFARDDQRRTPAERARFQHRQEEKRQETRAMVDDVFRVFDVQMTGREQLAGHGAIVFSLTPRPTAEPRTRVGGWLRHFGGRAWISESDYELIRVEVEAFDNLSIALGFFARVQKGARFAFERRQVDGAVWMPARASYTASARVLLLKGLRLNGVSEFSNYRKFSVGTSSTYGGPAAAAGPAN